SDLSSGYPHFGEVNLHRHRLAQDVQQHHGALLRILHLVGRLQPGKRAFGDHHGVTLAGRVPKRTSWLTPSAVAW
ncbi:MAG: hypothetical protein KAX73_08005, partial [Aquabacterium sp.]|nr:hypothetical protein [Aquabacterium sp.]